MNADPLDVPFDLPMIQAMTVTAAAELAQRWLAKLPDAHTHMAAGAGIELLVRLKPAAALQPLLVDSDGGRLILAERKFSAATEH
ncbi:MAG: hypothetical protein ABIP08_05995 [Lautropia sp.]